MAKLIRIGIIVVLIVSLLLSSIPTPAASPKNSPEFATDHILVKFKPGISAASMLSINQNHGGSIIQNVSHSGIQVVKIPNGKVLDEIKAYKNDPSVEYAEPDYIIKAIGTPSDPSFNQQWGLTQIQAPEAWDVTTGNSSIKIAILDTGIDQDHEDLAAKIVANQNCTQSPSTTTMVDDLYGHGTHVAGIAAAITNNGKGVAGVGYNASLMNVKVLDDTGTGTSLSMIEGIYWAADNGAKVINMSFGHTGEATQDEEDTINYAWNKGVVVVASAGNNGSSAPNYPAAYANCISVAATDQNDGKASFSAYGSWVDVAAPGVGIYSTLPNHPNTISTQLGSLNYGSLDGTSMAAPFVSGLAALVWATSYGTSNSEVRNQIESRADPIAGTGTYWQKGRINALRTLKSGVPVVATSPATDITSTSATLNGNLISLDTAPSVQVSFEYGTTPSYGLTTSPQTVTATGAFSTTITGLTPDKTYYFRARASGNGPAYGGENILNTWLTPPGGKIAFISNRDGYYGIYVMNANGSNPAHIGSPGCSYPAFSPDGTQIAYGTTMGNPDSPASEIFVINTDGSHKLQLTNNGKGNERPAWSPDGTRIAYVSSPNGTAEIYTMNADGSNQTRLTSNTALDTDPNWSPDGKYIAFVSNRDGNPEIYRMNIDGTNVVRLTINSVSVSHPAWSPDGTKIAFQSFTQSADGNHNEIYMMNNEGTNISKLTTSSYGDEYPAWSPDGKQIAFVSLFSLGGGAVNPEIYIMNADGSNQIRLTYMPYYDYEPTWGTAASAAATITLGNLNQTYDGSPKAVTFTTNPLGLTASVTYNGSTTPPTNAGNYAIAAIITSPGYTGNATGTLTIAKATPIITWNNPVDIPFGVALNGNQLNATANIPGTFAYSPPAGTILNAGNGQTLSVIFTPTDTANYNPAGKSVIMNIQKASPSFSNLSSPTINFGNTSVSLGGNIKAGVLIPFGNVSVSLNGLTQSAAINATGDFSSTFSTSKLQVGVYPLNYSYGGDANFDSLTDNSRTLTVGNTSASITLGNLDQIYDGNPKTVTYTTNPAGLTASITYNGSASPPTGAGSYDVIAMITSPDYIGSATGILIIAQATPIITWNNPADITYGTALSSTQLNATAGIPGAFSYSPPTGTVLNAGNGQTLSVTFTPTDTANYNPATKSVTINVNMPPVVISGGGGGGGAPPPPPMIKSVTINGFSSATDLKVNSSGNVQASTQLSLEDGQATLDISQNTKLVDADGKALDTLSASKLDSVSEPPPPQAAIINAYEFGPDGAQFNPPLTLTLKYDPQSLPSSMDGNKITLAFWNGSRWETVESTLDAETNTLTAKISHFSEYALMAELAPARFTLSDLQINEDKSSPDDPVTIQTVVTNSGGSQGKCTLNLTLNSFGINKKEVTLDVGQSQTASFTLENLLPGKYIVDINGRSSQFTIEVPSGAIAEKPQIVEPQPAPPTPLSVDKPITTSKSSTSTPSPEKKSSIPLTWLMIDVVVFLVLIAGILFIRRRRKR